MTPTADTGNCQQMILLLTTTTYPHLRVPDITRSARLAKASVLACQYLLHPLGYITACPPITLGRYSTAED